MAEDNTTACGRIKPHSAHVYETRKGKKICDGVLRNKKRGRA